MLLCMCKTCHPNDKLELGDALKIALHFRPECGSRQIQPLEQRHIKTPVERLDTLELLIALLTQRVELLDRVAKK